MIIFLILQLVHARVASGGRGFFWNRADNKKPEVTDTYTPPARVIVSKLNLFKAMMSTRLAGYVVRIAHGIGSKGFRREQGTGKEGWLFRHVTK